MIARPSKAAHVRAAVASDTLLRSRVAHFGRFLPRLGPFDYRTAFFCAPSWSEPANPSAVFAERRGRGGRPVETPIPQT